MSYINIKKKDWSKILDIKTYPIKGSFYVGYDISGKLGFDSETLLQMDENGVVTPICSCDSSGTTVTYMNEEPVPEKVGGVEIGRNFPFPHTMQEMWDILLYPYQYPLISLSLNKGPLLEIGDSFMNATATWNTTNQFNVVDNTTEIYGYNLITVFNLPKQGSQYLEFYLNVTRNSIDQPGIRTWNIRAKNTKDQFFSNSYSIRWDWMFYWGQSTNSSLDEAGIKNLQDRELKSNYVGIYTFGVVPNYGYKYIGLPDYYGIPNTFIDNFTGYMVAMQSPYTLYINNDFGQITLYNIYRTSNIINSDIKIIVT